MDHLQRVKDCHRRAAVVYPHLLEARRHYQRLDRLWTYWMNKAYEAERRTVEVTVVDSKLTQKKIKDFKDGKAKKILQALSPQQRKELVAELQEEIRK